MLAETDNLLNVLTAATEDRAKIQQACERLVAAAEHASPQHRSEAVRRFSPVILNADLKRAGMCAALCGMLVETGADPAPLEEPLLTRLLSALRAGDVEIVDALAPPAIALFSAKPALRAAHRDVRDLAESFGDRVAWCAWLPTIFDVLEDEPLLVIEPSTHTGILARLSGADLNFTLNMLLMHRFPDATGQPHSRLSPKAAGVLEGGPQDSGEWVQGVWNLYNWEALDQSGSLAAGQKNSQHWIWNEGAPSDISTFAGRRVVLLGPAAYARSWPAQRTFAAMRPSLHIEKLLTPDEVQDWLHKMIESRSRPAA